MCAVCGCGRNGTTAGEHTHVGPDGKPFTHSHSAKPEHDHDQHRDAPRLVRVTGEIPGLSARRVVRIQEDILGKNNALAAANRRRFAESRTFVVNLMSSPGSGKTTLLTRTLLALKDRMAIAVIEGDQQTSFDADRIRATGAPAVQINTGKGCHLDATMIARALEQMPAPRDGLLFIENVGNLVCPAGFDLGEAARAVVISVTEGEDKPLKYPDMFATADVVIVNKADLLPHLVFDVEALERNVHRVRPGVPILQLSATTGNGLESWLTWLHDGIAAAKTAVPA